MNLISIAQDEKVALESKKEILNAIEDELLAGLQLPEEEISSPRNFLLASIMEAILRDQKLVEELSAESPEFLSELTGKIIDMLKRREEKVLGKTRETGEEMRHYMLDENLSAYVSLLARMAKSSDEIKQMVKDGLQLEGIQKEIFDEYGILVINGWGEFNPEDYESIKNVLSQLEEVFGKEEVKKLVNAIIRMPRDLRGVLGAAFPNGITWLYGDLHNYPIPGKADKKVDIFEEVLFHELAHHMDFNLLAQEQHDLFGKLHFESGYDPDNYARLYGTVNRWEDFATMVEAWGKDSLGIITKARNNSDPALLRKVLFVAEMFTFNDQVYLFKEVNGQIKIDKVLSYAEFIKMLTGLTAE
jgi:predicted Zn-dependent protease with MMP-like domain